MSNFLKMTLHNGKNETDSSLVRAFSPWWRVLRIAYVASLVSIVALIWAGRRLFETVERSLTEIWPGKVLRGYFTRKLVTFSMMLVAGLLLAGFMLFNVLLAAAQSWLQQFPEIPATFLSQTQPHFLLAYQFVLSYIAFGLLYKFMPVQHVPTKVALVGAAVAAVLWM